MLATSTPGAIFICAIPAVLVLIGLGIVIFCWLRTRQIATTPSLSGLVTEAGFAGLEGRTAVLADRPTLAPLTRTPCCWYQYRIEHYRPDESSGDWIWSTLEEGTSEIPFEVTDGVRPCVVWPAEATVLATDKSVWSGRTRYPEERDPHRDRPNLYSATQWNAMSGGSQDTPYRYTEERIYAGDEAFILGWFHSKMVVPPSHGIRDEARDDDDEDFDDEEDEDGEDPDDTASTFPNFADPSGRHAGKGSFSKPPGREPFSIFAMNRAEAAHLHRQGMYAGLFLALVGGVGVALASKIF